MDYHDFETPPTEIGCGYIQYEASEDDETPSQGVWNEADCTDEKPGLCETLSTPGQYYPTSHCE